MRDEKSSHQSFPLMGAYTYYQTIGNAVSSASSCDIHLNFVRVLPQQPYLHMQWVQYLLCLFLKDHSSVVQLASSEVMSKHGAANVRSSTCVRTVSDPVNFTFLAKSLEWPTWLRWHYKSYKFILFYKLILKFLKIFYSIQCIWFHKIFKSHFYPPNRQCNIYMLM